MSSVSMPGQADRIFFSGMSLALVASVFVGFAPTYYLKAYYRAPVLGPLVHLHGLAFTAWIVLFATQTVLVAKRQIAVHRKLGVAGAVLAAVMVAIGLATAIASARRDFAAGNVGPLRFLAIPLADMLVFLVLVAAGLYHRRRPDAHKRLMFLSTVSLIGAAIARWPLAIMAAGPVAFFALTDLFVLAAVAYDLASRGRVHPALVWGGLLLVASQPLRLILAGTETWLAIARAIVQ